MKASNVLAETVIAAALANWFCAGSPLLWAENESLPVSLRTHQAEAIAGKETRPDPAILLFAKHSLELPVEGKVHETVVKSPLVRGPRSMLFGEATPIGVAVKSSPIFGRQDDLSMDTAVLQWAERLTLTTYLLKRTGAHPRGFHQPADDEFKEALLTGLTAWVHSRNFESTLRELLEHAAPFSLTVMLPRTSIDSGTVEELANRVGLHGRQPGIEMSSWTLDLSFKSPDTPLLITGTSGAKTHHHWVLPPEIAAGEKF